MSTPTEVSTILYTTDGSTPSTAGMAGDAEYSNGNPPDLPTLIYSLGENAGCYGGDTRYPPSPNEPSCTPEGLVYATNGETIKAITVGASVVSAVTINTYTIATSNPSFSPATGNYLSSVTVTISDASPQATVSYTTDGTTPTSSSTPYTVPITMTTTTNLRSIAEQYGATNSAVTGGVYTIEIPGRLTTPVPNTTTPLSGTSVAFAWTRGNTTNFELWVGNTGVGSSNLYNSGNVTGTTETVSDLPSNGQTVNVRLYSLINGAWQSTDYTYAAYGSPTKGALTTPIPNTKTPLSGASVAFAWTRGNIATIFELVVGNTGAGSSNIYNSGSMGATTETVSDLPTNGETLNVRLYSLIKGGWQYADYTYVAHGSPAKGALTTPAPNTTIPLSGTNVTFAWTPGNSATHFELWVGNTGVGSSNLYNSGDVTVTTETVSDLPSNGQTVNVRLYSLINGSWQYTDYTYVAYGFADARRADHTYSNTKTPLIGHQRGFYVDAGQHRHEL